jgi:hypothetical protein
MINRLREKENFIYNDGIVKSRHSRENGNPDTEFERIWIPAGVYPVAERGRNDKNTNI